jgi:hypothetical protein
MMANKRAPTRAAEAQVAAAAGVQGSFIVL